MKQIANCEIRNKIKASGLTNWEVAAKIGVSEFTLCRWLRIELDGMKRQAVELAIEELTKEARA